MSPMEKDAPPDRSRPRLTKEFKADEALELDEGRRVAQTSVERGRETGLLPVGRHNAARRASRSRRADWRM